MIFGSNLWKSERWRQRHEVEEWMNIGDGSAARATEHKLRRNVVSSANCGTDFSTRDESLQTAWIVVEEGIDDFGGEDTEDDRERKLEETSPEEIATVGDIAEGDRCRRRCHSRRSLENARGSEIVAQDIQEQQHHDIVFQRSKGF